MKLSLLAFSFVISTGAFAEIGKINKDVPTGYPQKSKVDYSVECRTAGIKKLKAKLSIVHRAKLDVSTFDVLDIDDRFYSTKKYVYFSGTGRQADGTQINEIVGTEKTIKSLFSSESKCE